jgi:hypothetical protein
VLGRFGRFVVLGRRHAEWELLLLLVGLFGPGNSATGSGLNDNSKNFLACRLVLVFVMLCSHDHPSILLE